MQINQFTFIDGLDLLASDTQISPNGYYYLINARQRLGYIEPNNKPLEITTIPSGKKQGVIALGNVLIAFIAGKAWYNIDGSDSWIKIAGFSMSTTVDRYYSRAVPVGNVGYIRKLDTSADANKPIRKMYDFTINGTPACVLVQDGINQPWVIIHDTSTNTFSARVTKNYSQWQNDGNNREYVPIGKQMAVVDSKLFIVSADGKSVYHSISGRYLDFMINIDVNGNKLTTENQGGASSVSFAFDTDDITCLLEAAIPSAFIYGTARNIRIIALDYTRQIFGEPTFATAEIIEIGLVNQDSIVDILGDYALIDFEGVKSFNAVKQLQNEGRNSIFSLQLSRLLSNIIQTRCRAIVFNNYAIFNLDTKWSNLFAIYDTLLEKWVALDITIVGAVKQFAIVETSSLSKLYAITTLDKMYQLYASDERETPQLHTKSFEARSSVDGKRYNHKGEYLKLAFQDGSEDATVVVNEMVDGQKSGNRMTQTLPANLAGLSFPMAFPFIFNTEQRSEDVTFNLKDGLKGKKLSYVVQWDSDAKLQELELMTADEAPFVDKKQVERILT